MHYFNKVKNRLLKVILWLVIVDLTLTGSWLSYVNNQFRHMPVEPADATIILMGKFNPSYTALGNKTLRRINAAIPH